jgi:hypothetical protein
VTVIALPEVDPLTTEEDDDLTHFVCCNPLKALCGTEIPAGEEWTHPDADTPDDCVVCLELTDKPCGEPFCALRCRWRWTRWGKFGRMFPP